MNCDFFNENPFVVNVFKVRTLQATANCHPMSNLMSHGYCNIKWPHTVM